jgi:hypothetical protein
MHGCDNSDHALGCATGSSDREVTASDLARPCWRALVYTVAVPAVNQIEQHPYFAQREVEDFGAQHGILAQSWSPIGGITFYRGSDHTSTLEDPTIGLVVRNRGSARSGWMRRIFRVARSRTVAACVGRCLGGDLPADDPSAGSRTAEGQVLAALHDAAAVAGHLPMLAPLQHDPSR